MAQIITINKEDEFFPEAFKAIGEDCPERIYAMGNLDLLKREHLVAIIGSRKATRTGNSKAYNLGISYARKDMSLSADWLWVATHRLTVDAWLLMAVL